MERKTMSNDESADYVDGMLDQLDATRMKGLEKAKELQQVNQTQMESELQRLTKKYGLDHTRVQKMKARMDNNGQMAGVIDQQIKITKIKTEPFDADSWRIQGFVYKDDGATPFPDLIVSIAVEKGEGSNRSQFSGYTDDAGSYSITVGKDSMEELKLAKVFLEVSDSNKRVLYRAENPLAPVSGMIDIVEDIIIAEKEYSKSPGNYC